MEQQLHDIRGLDVSYNWLLLTDWIIAFIVLIALLFILWLGLSIPRGQGWQADARRQLIQLRRRLQPATALSIISEFSILLRRIAIARCGRVACAGLTGEAWLLWLQQNDPKGFAWQKHKKLLLDYPYAPDGVEIDVKELRRLLKASRYWIEVKQLQPSYLARLFNGLKK